jgi:NAD-dependent dihydropyrimidine dehydrogenase PreA subunit
MEQKEVYQALTERMGVPDSKLVPKIWELLVTPEEGRMLLELPAFAEELAEKFSMDLGDLTKELKAKVDPDKCYGCGVCVPNCPEEALELKLVRPPDLPTD